MFRPAATPPSSAGFAALVFAGRRPADARADLHAAFMKNMSAKSYRATMTDLATDRQVSEVEFQAPDRYRIRVAGGPGIGDRGRRHVHAGQRPDDEGADEAGMMEQFRSDAAWKKMEAETLIKDAGLGTVGAEPAHKYHWISSGKNASTGDVWVGVKSGYVIQVETAQKAGSKAGAVAGALRRLRQHQDPDRAAELTRSQKKAPAMPGLRFPCAGTTC
jgi:hypothetical protein